MKKVFRMGSARPNFVMEELTAVLGDAKWIEFKPLFLLVYAKLLSRKSCGGGEEMLRLRTYDALQGLVRDGVVEKDGKRYRCIVTALRSFVERLTAPRFQPLINTARPA